MSKRKPKPAATRATVPVAAPSPPDPIDVITQHWADLTGITRKDAAAMLIQIGHATMRENRAAVSSLRREIEILTQAKTDSLDPHE